MLGILPNSIPDGINKGLRLTQASAKKGFKFLLGDRDITLILYLPLLLLQAKWGGILEKSGGK